MIIDQFNRVHNYLRISLTDNCNFRCFYCMPEEEYEFTTASKLMQANEIEAIAKTFVSMLSRGIAGFVENTLVITLPGSTKGTEESMDALFPYIFHIFKVAEGMRHD